MNKIMTKNFIIYLSILSIFAGTESVAFNNEVKIKDMKYTKDSASSAPDSRDVGWSCLFCNPNSRMRDSRMCSVNVSLPKGCYGTINVSNHGRQGAFNEQHDPWTWERKVNGEAVANECTRYPASIADVEAAWSLACDKTTELSFTYTRPGVFSSDRNTRRFKIEGGITSHPIRWKDSVQVTADNSLTPISVTNNSLIQASFPPSVELKNGSSSLFCRLSSSYSTPGSVHIRCHKQKVNAGVYRGTVKITFFIK